MNEELQMLKDELELLVTEFNLNSQEVLCLSRQIDRLIVEHYKRQRLTRAHER